MSENADAKDKAPTNSSSDQAHDATSLSASSDMGNVLKHIKDLETNNSKLQQELSELRERNGRLSQKTREGMQSALDTLMKKWMDSCETGQKVKEDFKCGLEKLVKNSAEDNGVWQMMVSASALHQRQEHDLEKLQKENNDLRTRVNGMYGSESTRVVGEKSKAESELVRPDFATDGGGEDIWNIFARDISSTQF